MASSPSVSTMPPTKLPTSNLEVLASTPADFGVAVTEVEGDIVLEVVTVTLIVDRVVVLGFEAVVGLAVCMVVLVVVTIWVVVMVVLVEPNVVVRDPLLLCTEVFEMECMLVAVLDAGPGVEDFGLDGENLVVVVFSEAEKQATASSSSAAARKGLPAPAESPMVPGGRGICPVSATPSAGGRGRARLLPRHYPAAPDRKSVV